MKAEHTILIVDDQPDFARGLARLIEDAFPEARTLLAESGAAALTVLEAKEVSLMLTDLRMPGMSGQELLGEALQANPALSVILITGFGSIESAVDALKAGAYDFLTKPVDRDSLLRAVSKAIERARLLGENRKLREMVKRTEARKELIGESPAMKRLKDSIAAVAASDYTVLVGGESGTGKEMVAREVHALSNRAANPLLSVNCPAIPDQLLESELFGHVKGAFTGADRNRKGLFVAADGGTLLLDEIGDIPMNVQTKLLRILQEQEVRPVGSSKSTKVDVRIIASTNQNLEEKMQAGQFREDLFYRLNVLNLTVPPLRNRIEDIPLLAMTFLSQSCNEMNLPQKELTPEVQAWLAANPWPGNIRELQNFMRRLAVFAHGDTIDISLVRLAGSGRAAGETQDLPPYKEAKNRVIDDFTRTYVRQLLKLTEGNVSHAARISGLERVSLQKILKRLDIAAADFKE